MIKEHILPPAQMERQRDYMEKVRAYNAEKRAEGKERLAFVQTFGCQQNEADSERLAGYVEAMGYTVTDAPEGASLILVNTCAIREHAEKRALSIIGQ